MLWPSSLFRREKASARGRARRTASGDATGTMSCSLPAFTHSGRSTMSPAESPRMSASSARDSVTSRKRGAFAVRVQRSPDAATGMTPAFISSASESPAPLQRAHHVRGPERRVPGEGHLVGRREDAHARGGPVRRQDERGLGEVELARERLHRRVVERAAVLEDAEGIAGERAAAREDVDDAVCEGRHHCAPVAASRARSLAWMPPKPPLDITSTWSPGRSTWPRASTSGSSSE